ncbi:hypothetical protein MKW92_021162 [Papaver armeniacum]|nr:hypothetical protein MKW92_021162 [Papaver armeniacum]
MALGVCIQAYKDSLRPTIAINCMILIGKRGGVLLIAAGVDANEQSYPLSFATVDSENGDAYTWFLRELRKALEPEEEIVFVGDRSGAINTGISIVFPEAEHVYCVHHISRNLAKYSEGVAQTFLNAVLAYNDYDFNSNMAKLHELSYEAAEEVQDLGFASWARVKARRPRFSMMITNPAGSFHCRLQIANSLPPVLIMEFIRRTLSVWFVDHRKSVEDWTGPLSELATQTINRRIHLVKNYEVNLMTRTRYKVSDMARRELNVVNIKEKTCSCGTFQMEFLPCLHALAVLKTNKLTEVVDM